MKLAANRLSPSAWLVSACVLAGARLAFAAPPTVRLASNWDLRELGRDFPQALAPFKEADAAAAAGKPREAARLFAQVQQLAPRSPAPPRRLCEVLTELGQRDEALRACRQALDNGDAPEDFRAMVGALMSGPNPPHAEELAMALLMASGLTQRVPHDPAGPAALFDIAHRLGDRRLMRTQLAALERLAPGHHDTGRARRLVSAAGSRWPALLGWGLLFTLCAATLARLIGRLRTRARLLPAAVTAAIVLAALAPAAHAESKPNPVEGLSTFRVDDADPEGTLPAREEFRKDPLQFGYLVMDLAEKADAATRRKDYPQALKYYRALVKIAPDRAIGQGKICEVHELAGDRQSALEACRIALRTEGVRGEDYERFFRLALGGQAPLTEAEKVELENVIAHLEATPDGLLPAAEIECQVGVRTQDVALLERCTRTLARLAPGDARAARYEWALATFRKDSGAARRALDRARSAGVVLEGLEGMERATRGAELTRSISYLVAVAMALAAAGLLFHRRREIQAALARRSVS